MMALAAETGLSRCCADQIAEEQLEEEIVCVLVLLQYMKPALIRVGTIACATSWSDSWRSDPA